MPMGLTDATSREISRDSFCPFPFARVCSSFCLIYPLHPLSVFPSRLPFLSPRSYCSSPCHRPSNYAVVVTSCHVIKLHLFTMRPDCYQACNSRDSASVSHRRFQSVASRSVPIASLSAGRSCVNMPAYWFTGIHIIEANNTVITV